MANAQGPASVIPSLDEVQIEYRDAVAVIRLSRPRKRNAISDGLMAAVGQRIAELPASVGAVVLHGEGEHFVLVLTSVSSRTVMRSRACTIRVPGSTSCASLNRAGCR